MCDYMTYKQVSELLSIPLGTLYSYVHRGLIPHYRQSKKLVRFKRSEILEWIESGKVEITQGEQAE